MTSHHRLVRRGSHVFLKLLGVGFTCLIPVGVLAYLTISALMQQVVLTRGELAGVDYDRSAMELIRSGIECRRVTDDYLYGRATRADLDSAQTKVDDQLRDMDERESVFAAVNGTAPKEALSALKSRWVAVKEAAGKARPDPRPDAQVIKDQTEWLALARGLHAAIGDSSLLLHDPDRAARNASDAMIRLLDDADHLSQLQMVAANAAQRKTLRADELAALNRLVGRVSAAGEAYDASWTAGARARPDFAAPLAAAHEDRSLERSAFIKLVTEKVLAPTLVDTTPRALRDAGQKAVDRDFEAYARLAPALAAEFNERVEVRRRQIHAVLICVAAGLALTLVTALVVAGGLARPTGESSATIAHLRKAVGDVRDATAAVQNAITPAPGNSVAARSPQFDTISKKIDQFAQRLDDVTERISIQALNASIQAAAAGEAGRKFAVVAAELERLAGEFVTATQEICTFLKTTRATETGASGGTGLTAAVERLVVATHELDDSAAQLEV